MKVLIPVLSFHHLTGSELYVFELGRELVRRGHPVAVAAHRVEGEMAAHSRAAGIEAFTFDAFPQGRTFDLIHANEGHPTRWALNRFPTTPILATVHSQFSCEQPEVSARVAHYICVRPEVQEKITRLDGIPVEKTSIIYNPIDFGRFHPVEMPPHVGKRVLFCGTIDRLRKAVILDLIRRTQTEGFTLQLVGLKCENYCEHLPSGVFWTDQYWHIEDYLQLFDETAGVLLGRTTIEGWACGKPGWIYDVDLAGAIRSRTLHQPPADMERFDSRHVIDQIEALYKKVLDSRSA